MNRISISVVGLGRLGLPLACVFAKAGFKVYGVDVIESKVEAINKRMAVSDEPGVNQIIYKYGGGRLYATTSYKEAIGNSSVTFVVVNTPPKDSGVLSIADLEDACYAIAKEVARKDKFHTIAIVSTVMPGTIDNEIKPILEDQTGFECETETSAGQLPFFGLVYNPTFIALGEVIKGLTGPDILLVGSYGTTKAAAIIFRIWSHTLDQWKGFTQIPAFIEIPIKDAEIAKLAINAYLTMKISFSSMLSELCEKVSGVNIGEVLTMLGADHRINTEYMKVGLGFGGPCFPKDLDAFNYFLEHIGCISALTQATKAVNTIQPYRVVDLIKKRTGIEDFTDKKVAILGMTYKPNINIIENSLSVVLAKRFVELGANVFIHEPSRVGNALGGAFSRSKVIFGDIFECVTGSDIVIIATPWPQFKDELMKENIKKHLKVVVDCWHLLDPEELPEHTKYIALGVGESA